MKDDVKLHILLGGGIFLRSSWLSGAGECVKIAEKWGFSSHGSRYRLATNMGVGASERGHQITYSDKRLALFNEI
jgi:hypothetical protein